MKLELIASKQTWGAGEDVTVRLLALNDAFEPAALDRRLLVGPNPVPESPRGLPLPVSTEPALDEENQNVVMLNPWCIYGRERTFPNLPAGQVTFYAYLLQRPADGMPPQGPIDPEELAAVADPLTLTVR